MENDIFARGFSILVLLPFVTWIVVGAIIFWYYVIRYGPDVCDKMDLVGPGTAIPGIVVLLLVVVFLIVPTVGWLTTFIW
jgi:hypothetical protein